MATLDWPDSSFTERVPSLAAAVSVLLASEPRWIHRRVETIEFVDDRVVRRRMSVDFTVPSLDELVLRGKPSRVLIPLSLFRKGVLRNLDVRTDDGRASPVLTREQNAAIAATVLVQQAADVLEQASLGDLSSEILDDLLAIGGLRIGQHMTHAEGAVAWREALVRLSTPVASPPSLVQDQQNALLNDNEMMAVISDLGPQFALIAVLEASVGERVVVKFSYEEPFELGSYLRRIPQGLGWMALEATIPVAGPSDAASYHAELVAPPELHIPDAQLVRLQLEVRTPSDAPWARAWRRVLSTILNREQPTLEAHETVLGRDGRTFRAHVYTPVVESDFRSWTLVRARFRLSRRLVWPSLGAATTSAAVLGGGLVLHDAGIAQRADVSATLIVVLPALFSTFVASRQHPLTQRVAFGLQVMTLLSAAVSFAAAASLALDFSEQATVRIWSALLATELVLVVALLVAFVQSGRKGSPPSDTAVY